MTDRVAVIAELFDIFEREGVDGVVRFFDPQIHWASPPDWMDQSGYDGYDGLRLLESQWRDNFDEYALTLEEVRPIGDRVVVLLHQHGRIRGAGDYVEQKVGWIVEYGDAGLITLVRAYFSWEETLEAADRS
jgi:ketosteroid isomerase-like protein